MGVKVGELIRKYYFYGISSVADLAYVIYDETGTSWATGNMTELASTGLYYVDWTPDAAGVWLFEITKGTVKDAFEFYVGQGQEADIETAIGSEFDGTPDLYDVLVTGYITGATATAVGSLLERLQLLQELMFANNTMFTTTAATVNTVTCATLVDRADLYEGMMLVPLNGDQAGQGRYITSYDGSGVLTVVPDWSTEPDGSGNFRFAVAPTPVKFNYEAGKGLSAIYDLVNGLPVLTRVYNDYNILVLATEETIFEYDDASYVWHPKWLVYHLDEAQAAEQFEVKVYEKDNDTDNAWVMIAHEDVTGVQAIPGKFIELPPVDLAFKVTVEQTGGVLRDVLFKLYKES